MRSDITTISSTNANHITFCENMLAGLPFDYSGLSPFCYSSFPFFFPPLCAVALFVRHVVAGLARSSLQQSWDHEKGRRCATTRRVVRCATTRRVVRCATTSGVVRCATTRRVVRCATTRRVVRCATTSGCHLEQVSSTGEATWYEMPI
jgi:hypothetical protein